MTDKKMVLVGVDGSEASLHALTWAIAESKRWDARIQLSCAFSMPSFTLASIDGGYAALDEDVIRKGAEEVLANAEKRVRDAGLEVSSSIQVGDPVGELIKQTDGAYLAVVGTKGRRGFAERLLGTVSSALPAHAHCAVVIVPFHTATEDSAEGPTADLPIKTIAVGVDGSEVSQRALRRAMRVSVIWKAKIVAFAAVPIATGAGSFAWSGAAIDRDALLDEARSALSRDIAKAKEAVGLPDSIEIEQRVLDGAPAPLLVEMSAHADLLVVGSRGRGGFSGLLLGSTSQAVLHHAVCPILVVPPRSREEEDGPHEGANPPVKAALKSK
jgi:nucleotide-binding universal stress UspA family protein